MSDSESALSIRRHQSPLESSAFHDELAAAILAREARDPGLSVSNVRGWHSRPDLMDWPEPAVTEFVDRIRSAVAASVGGDWACQMWATVMRAGAYHLAHHHGDAAWSGVYYVAAGDPGCGGAITFARTTTSCTIEPAQGLLLLFPGSLLHSVGEYSGRTPRISVGLNLARLPEQLVLFGEPLVR